MCTLECGLFLEDERLPGLTQQLLDEEVILSDIQGHFSLSACRDAITANEPMNTQTIWTDGASAHNQDARFRRAGSGIFYGPDHALNWSGLLPGLAQSNQRAELFAVLVACLRDPRPLQIRTDSEWVCKGFSSWRSWAAGGWQGEHADLWDMLACELSLRAWDVHVSWVKGHTKEIDVKRGRTTREDKTGNDGADKLAVAGAAAHHVLPEVVASAKARRHLAIRTHEMMVAILMERQKQESLFAEIAADRGSEMGEGSWDLELGGCMDEGSDNEDLPDTETACNSSVMILTGGPAS
jgi:ribonuclease HI